MIHEDEFSTLSHRLYTCRASWLSQKKKKKTGHSRCFAEERGAQGTMGNSV